MRLNDVTINNLPVSVYKYDAVVVGSGAAGFRATEKLYECGCRDIALITENINAGTSRNTGSDKQTYYKLSLSGREEDSVYKMASTLFNGQCVDGDIALCEAAHSVECFLHLTELGVPFPRNEYGEYIGYKTDHDPMRRATSVGPYTSKFMTEVLEKSVKDKNIEIQDKMQAVRILVKDQKVYGVLCLNLNAVYNTEQNETDLINADQNEVALNNMDQNETGLKNADQDEAGLDNADKNKRYINNEIQNKTDKNSLDQLSDKQQDNNRYCIFLCKAVIWATGGPAGMYKNSVYPGSQHGASGIAFLAGAKGKNLTEWQFGLASVKPRWNVSGSYMQVIPRFISTDQDGNDAKEFLIENMGDLGTVMNMVFLKGYQWPFDVRKLKAGSSSIDYWVYIELFIKKRRVFLDYRDNPGCKPFDPSLLSEEAFTYLNASGAIGGTPFERLEKLNQPAIDFYRDRGVDLKTQPLEISLSVQHNNGGISISSDWETDIKNLYAVGEVSASHGVYRPGGTALNAGQVGATRAAQKIASDLRNNKCFDDKEKSAERLDDKECLSEIETFIGCIEGCIADIDSNDNLSTDDHKRFTADELMEYCQSEMSRIAGPIRDIDSISEYLDTVKYYLEHFNEKVIIKSEKKLRKIYRLYNTLISQYVYLAAMLDYYRYGHRARGSALYLERADIELMINSPAELLNSEIPLDEPDGLLQEVKLNVKDNHYTCECTWRKARSIPDTDEAFEVVWKRYRERNAR